MVPGSGNAGGVDGGVVGSAGAVISCTSGIKVGGGSGGFEVACCIEGGFVIVFSGNKCGRGGDNIIKRTYYLVVV